MANWVDYAARLTKKGGIEVTSDGDMTAEDEYTVLMPWGERPGTSETPISGMPALGDALPEYANRTGATNATNEASTDETGERTAADLVARKVSYSQPDPTSRVWVATVEYGFPDGEASSSGDDKIKLMFINVSARTWTQDMVEDVNGDPVVNTAGDPFAEAVTVERFSPVVEIVRKETKSLTAKGLAKSGTINSAAITVAGVSIPARCGRLTVQAQQLDNSTTYDYQSTYRIEVNPDTWDVRVLSQGYNCIVDGVKITPLSETADGYRQPRQTPMLLDAGGAETTAARAYYQTFAPYADASWTDLKFPAGL